MKLKQISMRIINYFLVFSLFLASFSCKDKPDPPATFNKAELLANLSDNYIQPALDELKIKVNELYTSAEDLNLNPSIPTLDDVKLKWLEAYTSFQKIKMLDIGPAATIGFQSAFASFPSDTVLVEQNIANEVTDLSSFSNITAIGFPALDFVLYSNDANNKVLTEQKRRNYISAICLKMKEEIDFLANSWQTYAATFKAGTGTSSTDDFSEFVNAFCKDFEILKHTKVGIPIGKQSLGIHRPYYFEARYSKKGKELMLENLIAMKAIYNGNSFANQSAGIGFDDYLIALEKNDLNNTINTRFDNLINEASSWTSDMENILMSNESVLTSYYDYISSTVVHLKSDMTAAFGILITYQDNDGD